jgi:hypothetical protein
MKNAILLFCLGIGVIAFGQKLQIENSIPIAFRLDTCESLESEHCFEPHRLEIYRLGEDSTFLGIRAMIRCGFKPWHDSLIAIKKADTIFIKDIPRKQFWVNGKASSFLQGCECCHKLYFSIENKSESRPVIFIDRQQLLLNPVPPIKRSRKLEQNPDTLNHIPGLDGSIGSYIYGKEGLVGFPPYQLIKRPMLDSGKEPSPESLSPIGLFIYHKGDTIIESIDGIEHSLALKVTVKGRIIETRFDQGYWFRTTPGKAGRIKSVEVVFPDGHIERWP